MVLKTAEYLRGAAYAAAFATSLSVYTAHAEPASTHHTAPATKAEVPANSTPAQASAEEVDAVKAIIWEKEKAIYAGRAQGDVGYYIDNTSPNFLAWTSGTKIPFRVDKLKASRETMKGRDQELITNELLDFSLSGDTAIIYYRNHRSRLPDGTIVDQTYDNIHVWQRTNGDWKVLASMSRKAEGL